MAREKGPARKSKQESAREVAELAKLSRLATDLSDGKMPKHFSAELLVRAERQLGMRCNGCGQRVQVGFKFTLIEARVVEGRPTVDVSQVTACDGIDDCGFADEVRKADPTPMVVEMVEFAWLGPDPADELPDGHEPDAKVMPEEEAYDGESSPEAAGNGSPAPASPPVEDEAASASGDESLSKIELPPGVDRD